MAEGLSTVKRLLTLSVRCLVRGPTATGGGRLCADRFDDCEVLDAEETAELLRFADHRDAQVE